MASPEKRAGAAEPTVTRTYRTAIRLGEDFITLEETVTLPIDASDEDVAQAVDLGWRIYRAQRAAVEQQVAGVREAAGASQTTFVVKDPDAPASDKQRNYIAALQEDLAWTSEQLGGYAHDQQVDLVTLTKGQASSFIDGLKKLAEDRGEYERTKPEITPVVPVPVAPVAPAPRSVRPSDGNPAADKQLQALERLSQQRGLSLEAEAQRRYGVAVARLTYGQAGELLSEWQRRS
jgi:hypothetical protein